MRMQFSSPLVAVPDSFDYQTEDREVQWELEEIPRPTEDPGHFLRLCLEIPQLFTRPAL